MRLGGRLGGEGNVGVKAKRWNNQPGQVCANVCQRSSGKEGERGRERERERVVCDCKFVFKFDCEFDCKLNLTFECKLDCTFEVSCVCTHHV